MDRLHLDESIFSPIRYDASLGDISINSAGSVTHASNIECVFESPEMKSDEQKDELMSYSNQFELNSKSKKLGFLNSPVSSDKSADSIISRGSFTDLEKDKAKTILSKENSEKTLARQNKRKESKQNEISGNSSGQNEARTKNVRPATLLPSTNKLTESITLKDNKKENKVARKSTVSRNSNNENDKKNSIISSENHCRMIGSSLAVHKSINLKESKDNYMKGALTSNTIEMDKKSEILTQHSDTSKSTSNSSFQSEYEVSVEKIVHDHISFECDKVRQNIYMQQMSFYRQLNKIKDEMEQQHLATTERLFKVIEELAQVNTFLKEKLCSP